jgi:hypothetical protein
MFGKYFGEVRSIVFGSRSPSRLPPFGIPRTEPRPNLAAKASRFWGNDRGSAVTGEGFFEEKVLPDVEDHLVTMRAHLHAVERLEGSLAQEILFRDLQGGFKFPVAIRASDEEFPHPSACPCFSI